MKFKLILAGVLFSLMSFAPEQVFAKSSVSTFRIPESNLQSLAVVYVEPIKFSDMDENEIAILQIELMLKESLANQPLPLVWLKTEGDERAKSSARAGVLEVQVHPFGWDNYMMDGYYESYRDIEYYDTWVWEDGYRDGKNRERRRRLIRMERPVLKTRYVQPRLYEQARAQIDFILRDAETKEVLWFYSQERLDTQGTFGGSPSPNKSLQIITQEAAKALEKAYKEDLKKAAKKSA